MSSDSIITVENLGKRYRLGAQSGDRYTALRDVVAEAAARPFRSLSRKFRSNHGNHASQPISDLRSPTSPPASQEFWALKDVSFEVRQGEVLGIIGRNGAGKSTLLKILSRITDPTEGRVRIRGRVASLLEVGTGFHPELTGRENIFLNGAILGMHRAEIKAKFDEIVAFAEVEKFLDTPVKRYSSGMYVRLAFAVAAHLEPEILIVDEVLAVGDAEFQKKCLGKMDQVAKGGRTVLFVSHNMIAVRSLSSTGILLTGGRMVSNGSVEKVITDYMGQAQNQSKAIYSADGTRPQITGVSLDDAALAEGCLRLEIQFISPYPLCPPVPGIVLSSSNGTPVFGSNPRFHNVDFNACASSAGAVLFEAANLPLRGGNYAISVWLGDLQADYDHKPDALNFEWNPPGDVRGGKPDRIGHINWPAKWKIRDSTGVEFAHIALASVDGD